MGEAGLFGGVFEELHGWDGDGEVLFDDIVGHGDVVEVEEGFDVIYGGKGAGLCGVWEVWRVPRADRHGRIGGCVWCGRQSCRSVGDGGALAWVKASVQLALA